jgi:hypothetical protein
LSGGGFQPDLMAHLGWFERSSCSKAEEIEVAILIGVDETVLRWL